MRRRTRTLCGAGSVSMWMSDARWLMASSITELMSRTRVLSDSLITSACSVSASGDAVARLVSSSCEVARAPTAAPPASSGRVR